MHGFNANIERLTLSNTNYRRVLYTARHCQLVLMCLQPKQEIGFEVHSENDQFFRIEHGQGVITIDGHRQEVGSGSAVIVPARARHNVVNTSATEMLQLYTIYAPPHHQDGLTRLTKDDADTHGVEFDGRTSE